MPIFTFMKHSMKPLLVCLFLIGLCDKSITAQSDSIQFSAKYIYELHQALVKKDKLTLDSLIADVCTYGHSNAWIENKGQLLENNESGFLNYVSIQEDSMKLYTLGETAIARFKAGIRGTMKQNSFLLDLSVMQVWIFHNKRWQLLARQAVKIP